MSQAAARNLRPRENGARVAQEQFEQRELLGRQLDLGRPSPDPLGCRLELQIALNEGPGRRDRRAGLRRGGVLPAPTS